MQPKANLEPIPRLLSIAQLIKIIIKKIVITDLNSVDGMDSDQVIISSSLSWNWTLYMQYEETNLNCITNLKWMLKTNHNYWG